MYGGGAYGKVKSKNKVMNIRAMQLMAQKVANIALPKGRFNDMFGKLRDRAIKNWGDFGQATAQKPSLGDFLGIRAPELPIEQDHETKRSRARYETRDEIFRQQAAASGTSLPMLGMAPRAGIASAPAAGPYAAAAPTGSERVDDTGWHVTLNQILGSGMISQQQLQAASYSNVYSMIDAFGMTEYQKREMTFFMQRMILEGYVRGVDMIREIKSQNGGKIRIGLQASVCNSSWADGCGDYGTNTITFRSAWWNNRDDKLKLSLFYHEVGHAILNRPHTSYYSLMQVPYNQITNRWHTNSEYTRVMDELFRGNVNSKLEFTPQRHNVPVATALNILNGGGPTGPITTNPSDPNAPVDPTNPMLQPIVMPAPNVTNISQTFNPVRTSPTAASGAGQIDGSGGRYSSPRDVDKTPVAGVLPDMASVHTFAAGLQEASSKQSGPIGGLAGALTKFKHGA